MVFIAILVGALVSARGISAAALERIPIDRAFFFYEQNVGQADPAVRFLVRGVPNPTHVTADSLALTSGSGSSNALVRFSSSPSPTIRSLEAWPGTVNRFEGDSKRWLRAIPAHRRVQYTDIHPGVDLILREARGQPSFTFVVRPGGDVRSLFLEVSGSVMTSSLSQRGDWSFSIYIGSWTFSKPRARQPSADGAENFLDARFVSSSTRQVRFQVPAFDRDRPLYVDVDLLPGSSSPSSYRYPASALAVDASNNIYFSGSLASPFSCGNPFGSQIFYCADAFVAAVRPSGEPIFFTVLAGRYEDSASQLALDSASNIIVAGNSASAEFPVTPGAFQPVNAGPLGPRPVGNWELLPAGDLFLARLDSRTGDLLYSTFFGGPDGDTPTSMALGRDGTATVLASVGSGFPTTAGAWIRSSTCQSCNAVVRFDAALARPLFSSFLPDALLTAPVMMAVHTDLSAYVAGSARAGAPTTAGSLQPNNGGESDAYIVRLAPDGSRPLFASYFGGAGSETVYSLAVESRGDAWLYGETRESTSDQTGWLIRVRSDGSQLVSSELHPGGRVRFSQMLSDAAGGLLLSGLTFSPVLPTTAGALSPAGCGYIVHGFLEQRDTDGALQVGTYLPGPEGYAPWLAAAPSGGIVRFVGANIERIDLRAPATQLLACVTGAASRRNSGRVSPGEIITLVGSRLGPENGVSADPRLTGRYPTSLAGVRVLVGNIPAPLLYVQASQINAVVPYAIVPGESIDVAVEFEGRTSTTRADAVRAEFSLFTADASGSGQAAALNEDGTLNSASNPARRGSIVALFGTGAGVTIPPSADGALAPVVSPDALPRIGNPMSLDRWGFTVVYAGAAPGLVNGVTQIDVRIPEQAAVGINSIGVGVDLTISPGNYATIAVQ